MNVLNYSPGPVKTDMLETLQDHHKMNAVAPTRAVLTTGQTVNRLIEVLQLQNYKSGDHFDYYNN